MNKWFAALAMLALIGCGSSGSGEAESGGSEETGGDETSEYEGPIASTDTDKGSEVFAQFCDDCHPDGEEDVGPSLVDNPLPPAALRKQVREGSGKMRPFSTGRISDDDLEALLAYLATINAVR